MAPVPLIAAGAMTAMSVASSEQQRKQQNNAKQAKFAWGEVERKKTNARNIVSSAQQAGDNYLQRMDIAESAALTQMQNMKTLDDRLADQITVSSYQLAGSLAATNASLAGRNVMGGGTAEALRRQQNRFAGMKTTDLNMNAATERDRIKGNYDAAMNSMDALSVDTPTALAPGVGPQMTPMNPLGLLSTGLSGAMQGYSMGQTIQGWAQTAPPTGGLMGPADAEGNYS
tara:strand:- start:111 stop:797 length:687 start_codon:yes stop_codon:yes gene_type:complete